MTATDESTLTSSEPPRRRRSRVGLYLLLGFALVLVVQAVVLAVVLGGDEKHATYSFVIPAGTGERLDRGEKIVIMPNRLEMRVGDRMKIENQDVRVMTVGPFTVRPGERFSHRFAQAGIYQGYCAVGEGKVVQIVVT